jgi:hypothetical protein
MRGAWVNDPVLAPVFQAKDPQAREEAIHALLTAQAAPQIAQLISAEIARGRILPEHRADLESEITLRLLRRLRQLVRTPSGTPIRHFGDYVSTTTYNLIDDELRGQDPLRTRLTTRVRYVLTHTPQLALWGREPALCGLARWTGRKESVPVAPLGDVPIAALDDAVGLRRAVTDVLYRSGGPVDLRQLVDLFAEALRIEVRPFVSAAVLRSRAVEHDPMRRLAGLEYLRQLWAEIEGLPRPQRCALLLQMRLEDGESVCHVLTALGIVLPRTLAETMEMSIDQLLALWNELPLADHQIAPMLDVTRQQVVNLRKAARERLARRMKRGQ